MKNKNCIHYFVKYENLETAIKRVKVDLSDAIKNGASTNDLILKALPLGYYMVANELAVKNLSEDVEEELVSRVHLEICEYFHKNPDLTKTSIIIIMNRLKKRISESLVTDISNSFDVFDNMEKNELPIPIGYQKPTLTANGLITKKAIIKELIGEVIKLLGGKTPWMTYNYTKLYIFRSYIFGIKTADDLSKELGMTPTNVLQIYNRSLHILLENMSKEKIEELRGLI